MRDNGGQHHIIFVDDGVLKDDQDFAFLECGGETWLAYNRNRITPEVLEESWLVYRERLATTGEESRQQSSNQARPSRRFRVRSLGLSVGRP